ncbi:MAG TPA: hypothetical protein VIF62_38705 [Labilithrix sp.]
MSCPCSWMVGVVAVSWILPRRLTVLGRIAIALGCAWTGQHQIRDVSRTNANLEPRVAYWREQVRGLGEMGRWLERTLPRRSTVATVAAGALPYYATNLRCIDVLGLTDAHIARHGNKDPNGGPGHIASDWPYVIDRAPDVYVSTGGGGFSPTASPRLERVLAGRYVPVVFEFKKTTNTQGRFVTLMLRADEAPMLRRALASDPDVRAL